MNGTTQVSLGTGLLVIGSAIVLGYSLVEIPAVIIVLAVIGMAIGTLLVGTSRSTV